LYQFSTELYTRPKRRQ